MKHLVFFSGGAGSYAATKRVLETVDKEDLHLLFTDTQIEDQELYRFMIDALEKIYEIDLEDERQLVKELTATEVDLDKRKRELFNIQSRVNAKVPNMHWIRYEVDGVAVDPWSIFYNDRFIGNSRIARCSTIIKQRLARDYVRDNFEKDDLVVYLGIDWMEVHRSKVPRENWSKFASDVRFPMCEEPYLLKDDIVKLIELDGIRIPTPYLQGAAHLNCGGFCVRGGQGHFARLLQVNPDLFEYHATKERDLNELIQSEKGSEEKYSILKHTIAGETTSITLDELRDKIKNNDKNLDLFSHGGCGCFVTKDRIDDELPGKWGMRDLKVVVGR